MQPFRRATHVIVTHDLDALEAHLLGRQSVGLPGKTRCEFCSTGARRLPTLKLGR
jgi:hypothetical protein